MKKLLLCLLFLPIYFTSTAQCVSTAIINMSACGFNCSGLVTMTITGGTPPYVLNVEINGVPLPPITTSSFWQQGNLCPGDLLSFTVVDDSGYTCAGNGPLTMTSSPPIDAQVTVTNATCAGCADGTATLTSVTGGTPPYGYQWSTGATGASITNLTPGTYIVWTGDINWCTDIDTFVVGVGNNGYNSISGQVYFDSNSNGVKDSAETGVGNIGVNLMPSNIDAISNTQGNYAFVTDTGMYDVTLQSGTGWNLTSSPATYTVNVSSASITGLDFGVFPDSSAGGAYSNFLAGWPRCFYNVPYYLTVYNTGYTYLSGTMILTHDPAMTYVSSTVLPTSQAGNVLSYSYSNLGPGQNETIIVILTAPAAGTVITNALDVTASDGFGFQYSNSYNQTQVVTCAVDPNDKVVQPAGQGVNNFVTMDTWLDYMIRFQNTGTDTAFTVVVIDTLDAGLDMNTFALLGASHAVNVTTRPGNEITFMFNNILLADSNVNEPASHGYIMYRVKGNANNPDPTIINNTAYIYFDLNNAVVTNTTLTTFSDNFLSLADDAGSNELFELFPNPMNDLTLLRLKYPSDVKYTITMTDIQGRKIFASKKLVNGSLLIENNDLQSGTYILEAIPDNHEKPVHLRLVKN